MGFFDWVKSSFSKVMNSGFGKFIKGSGVLNTGKEAVRSIYNTVRDGGDLMGAVKSVGRSAAQSIGDQLLNKTFDTAREFASNKLSSIAPEYVKPFESGAESLKSRLNSGYDALFRQGGPSGGAKTVQGSSVMDNVMSSDSLTK